MIAPFARLTVALAVALALTGGRERRPVPAAGEAAERRQKAPKGPFHTLTVGKHGCKYKTIQAAVDKPPRPATRSRSRTASTARA